VTVLSAFLSVLIDQEFFRNGHSKEEKPMEQKTLFSNQKAIPAENQPSQPIHGSIPISLAAD